MNWQSEAIDMQQEGVEGMSAFSERISSLCASTDRVAHLCRALMEINAADSALEQLARLRDVVEELCAHLETWLSRTDLEALQKNFLSVRFDLEDVRKIGIRFRLVATLTAINAVGSSSEVDGFVEELRAVPELIGEAVDSLLGRMTTVNAVVVEAATKARLGLASMEQARSRLAGHTDASESVFQQIGQSREALEGLGGRFLGESQEQTSILVRGFQYSDFFAQRLDHIAQMLAWEADLGPAVRLLAARQLAALSEHGQETVRDMVRALQAQSGTMAQFLEDFGVQGKIGAEGNQETQNIFSAILASRETALPVIVNSVASSRQVLEEIAACNDSFAKLVDMSGVMDLAAINARIRAVREEKSRAAMAFLSGAVLDGASQCRDVLTRSSDDLAKVAALQDRKMLDDLVDCVDRFRVAFDACRAGLVASEERLVRLDATLAEVAELIGAAQVMVQDCRSTAADLTRIVADLAAFGARLAKGVAVPAVWPDMSVIYDRYTIQAERDIHDLLIGRPLSAPPPAKALELDDIFF